MIFVWNSKTRLLAIEIFFATDDSSFLSKNENERRETQKLNKDAISGNFHPSWNQREKHNLYYFLYKESNCRRFNFTDSWAKPWKISTPYKHVILTVAKFTLYLNRFPLLHRSYPGFGWSTNFSLYIWIVTAFLFRKHPRK